MTISEKLREVAKFAAEGKLLLYGEGMFWKAYQEATYLFVKYIKSYQINSNYVKKVQTDVLSLGFPKPSVSKVLSGFDYQETDERIVISFKPDDFVESDYVQWYRGVIPQPLPAHRPAAETLLILKHIYDLVLYFYQLNRNVSREYKFSLCEKIKEEMHEMLMLVHYANEEDDASELFRLVSASERLLMSVKIRIRILYDLKQINLKQFAHCSEMLTDVKDELDKWITSLTCSR